MDQSQPGIDTSALYRLLCHFLDFDSTGLTANTPLTTAKSSFNLRYPLKWRFSPSLNLLNLSMITGIQFHLHSSLRRKGLPYKEPIHNLFLPHPSTPAMENPYGHAC